MEWIDAKTVYTIMHIFGAVIGAGGAFVSDAMFFATVKDRVISKGELRFLKIGSNFVWAGLALLLISGLLLFSTNPAGYLASDKFLIKMFVVLAIFLNGIVFHANHLPRMHRHADQHYPSSDEFTRKKKFLVASGAVSMSSWSLALILGVLGSIPISFTVAVVGYIALEIGIVAVSIVLADRLL